MDWFDAVFHAFSTVATGGFGVRNESIAWYNSPAIEWVCTVFMLLAGFNFGLIYRALQGRFKDVFRSSEGKAYFTVILVSGILISISLLQSGASPGDGIRRAFFSTASILTTTGLEAADHNLFPPLAQAVLFILMFVGGCTGSTSGGVKVIRHVILWKQAGNELKRIIYPKGVFTVRLDNKAGRKDVVYGVAGFLFLYLLLLAVGTLVVCSAGLDLFSSLNAALLSLGNIGLGLGRLDPAEVFYNFPAYVKLALSFLMIAGRLELWTAFVFFSRDYWR
jgi:trk system potassium uptake protein TrkH